MSVRTTASAVGPVVDFPLRGEWLVLSSPSHPRYAFDIVAVDAATLIRGGLRRYIRGELRADDSLGWSAPVTAPADGVVLAARDGVPDREALSPVRDVLRHGLRAMGAGTRDALAGNHVILEVGTTRFVMAHLQCGSVSVQPGARVAAGERIGSVGNSGSSVAPHLHFQSATVARRSPLASAPRFHVREYEQWRDGRWTVVREAPLPRFGRVRVR